jgi:hypothetical protein
VASPARRSARQRMGGRGYVFRNTPGGFAMWLRSAAPRQACAQRAW